MRAEQPKYGVGMTVSACAWLGLFPLLHGGTYRQLTGDKWMIMLYLAAGTLLCFLADLFLPRLLKSRSPAPGTDGRGAVPLILASALLLWCVLTCLLSAYGADIWWIGEASRREGLASRLCYLALFSVFFFSRVNLKPVLISAAAGVTVFGVVVLLQRAGGNPFGLYPAGRSYAMNPEFQGTIGNVDMGTCCCWQACSCTPFSGLS